MPAVTSPSQFPQNPHYGEGIFRRRIRLQGLPGKVVAELEDCCHGFRTSVYHNGEVVTDIQAEALRIPLTTCGGATEAITSLIGISLNSSASAINRQVDPRANCTHLYDLSLLAISHCLRGETIRQYDISVDDEQDQPGQTILSRDGEVIFNWQTTNWIIQAPAQLAGNSLFKGFANWATSAFRQELQEAAFVLQKGYFVAQSRRYDINNMAGTPVANHTFMHGACYSYNPGVVEDAYRTENCARDFTDSAEQLLKFT